MRPPRWKPLVNKSIAAMSAAIEIYNKPVIAHREEAFCILACSAWELLLKARLVQSNSNKMRAIFERENVRRNDGSISTRRRVKRNAMGNPVTISLREAIGQACALPNRALHSLCAENIKLLSEVRNNAIHFVNEDRIFVETVHGLAAASIRNYVVCLADWFNEDLAGHRFAILPLSFHPIDDAAVVAGSGRNKLAAALKTRIEEVAARADAIDERFAISVRLETRLVGTRQRDAIPIRPSRGPGATPVELNEETLLARFPYRYKDLRQRLREQHPGLRFDGLFHAIKRELESDPALVHERRLDPNNPRTQKVKFYGEGMIDAMSARLRRKEGEQKEAPSV